MSLKKSSLIILFSLLFFFVASTITSVGLIIKSNTSLDNVNKEIQVVLSIIDPINHSRTLRVRVMEYVKMVEAGDATDPSAKLASVKEALTKADNAFSAFMASPRLPDEAPLVTAYQEAWQKLLLPTQGGKSIVFIISRVILIVLKSNNEAKRGFYCFSN
ncbi:methyl-accepting chemotaxis protein III [Enterobacter hormaechei]|nr:methyl-accepting chemotaxis protein III [Enterobacter hormaechei]CZX90542.1 methyl-accepting chemotaxis protein III [Enterobacter hormaechei]